MSLQTPLFNIHDITLILVVFQSLLLAGLLLTVKQGKLMSNRLLALFIAAVGIAALDTLLYWCAPLKRAYLQESPQIFFLFKFIVLAQGPLLYFYVKSLIYTDFVARRRDLMHFLPVLASPIYTALILASLGQQNLYAGIYEYAIYWNNLLFRTLVVGQAVVVLLYAVASLKLMLGYERQIRENYSNLDRIERRWLKLLIIGFSLLCLWNLCVQLFSTVLSTPVSSLMGLSGNYLDFLFLNLLVFYNLLHSNVVQGVSDPAGVAAAADSEPSSTETTTITAMPQEPAAEADDKKDAFSPAQISAIEACISRERMYLINDLTLEQLATRAGLPPRTTSTIINRHFGMSFFDFINSHRVEAAKILLTKEPDRSVLDIAEMSGFNSKSAFNRFFKKFAGVTPTEFRRVGRG